MHGLNHSGETLLTNYHLNILDETLFGCAPSEPFDETLLTYTYHLNNLDETLLLVHHLNHLGETLLI